MILKREGIIGSSAAMEACMELVAQAAASDASVLITGETGTGKELFARAIHSNSATVGHAFCHRRLCLPSSYYHREHPLRPRKGRLYRGRQIPGGSDQTGRQAVLSSSMRWAIFPFPLRRLFSGFCRNISFALLEPRGKLKANSG